MNDKRSVPLQGDGVLEVIAAIERGEAVLRGEGPWITSERSVVYLWKHQYYLLVERRGQGHFGLLPYGIRLISKLAVPEAVEGGWYVLVELSPEIIAEQRCRTDLTQRLLEACKEAGYEVVDISYEHSIKAYPGVPADDHLISLESILESLRVLGYSERTSEGGSCDVYHLKMKTYVRFIPGMYVLTAEEQDEYSSFG